MRRYQDKNGKHWKYRSDATSGTIVFESGPFKDAKGQLLAGLKIGLNMDGGTFYAITCGLSN